jgi:hypothetical protein
MRINFKNLVAVPVVMAAALITTSALAETTLNVPFSFSVAGKNCPAGTYSVERNNLLTMVTLKSKSTAQSFSWIVNPGDPLPTDSHVVLRFDELEGTHALHSVQYGSKITSNLDRSNKQIEHVATRIVSGQ